MIQARPSRNLVVMRNLNPSISSLNWFIPKLERYESTITAIHYLHDGPCIVGSTPYVAWHAGEDHPITGPLSRSNRNQRGSEIFEDEGTIFLLRTNRKQPSFENQTCLENQPTSAQEKEVRLHPSPPPPVRIIIL